MEKLYFLRKDEEVSSNCWKRIFEIQSTEIFLSQHKNFLKFQLPKFKRNHYPTKTKVHKNLPRNAICIVPKTMEFSIPAIKGQVLLRKTQQKHTIIRFASLGKSEVVFPHVFFSNLQLGKLQVRGRCNGARVESCLSST